VSQILIVDDDLATRTLLRTRLEVSYDVAETGNATEALAMALSMRPDCILLDLGMPGCSGLELCYALASLSFTRPIPIFVVTGRPAVEYGEFCAHLGVREYFEKPIDFGELESCLAAAVDGKQQERRRERRLCLKVILKLCGVDGTGAAFEWLTVTENLSANGFYCALPIGLERDSAVEVYLISQDEQWIGRARVAHAEQKISLMDHYGFAFIEKPRDWVVR
jgi:two-component system, OmpR family, phosphate regulon response regulator PhoB